MKNALMWEYPPDAVLQIETGRIKPDDAAVGKYDFPYGFSCFLYSEQITGDILEFEFLTDNRVNQSFCYTINFTGWREITVNYDRGFMKGTFSPDMNRIRIAVKHSAEGGVVFLDAIKPFVPMRPTHYYMAMAEQIPNFPRHTKRSYIGTYEENGIHLNRPVFPLPERITDEQIQAFQSIEEKYLALCDEIDAPPLSNSNLAEQEALELYESYHFAYIDGYITGKHIPNGDATYIKAMRAIARRCKRDRREEDIQRYIDMLLHVRDQHMSINWYHGRGFATSILFMREILKERGLMDVALDYLKETYRFPRIYDVTSCNGVAGKRFEDTDVIGMDLPSLLVCVLLMENSPEKVRDMYHFIDYVEHTCLSYAPGLASGYKPDGTAFHHCGYITQYATVSNYSLARVIYMLSDSVFQISPEALARFRKTLETNFFIYNGCYEIFALAQYFFNDKKSVAVLDMAHFANAVHDKEMAGMFLRAAQSANNETQSANYQKFTAKGILPAEYPEGHKTLTYSAAAVHRRKGWMAAVKGYSKYVYSMEVWPDEIGAGSRYSAFSLFRSFGFLELLGEPSAEAGNNNGIHIDQGFDYCRWSGSTALKLPYAQIKSRVNYVEDERAEWLFSDQAFVGGLDEVDGNGVFALCLHGPAKYGLDSFFAKKSYHFYDDMILCVGSGITNDLSEYETETTLFQDFGSGAKQEGKFLEDNRGHGYYVLNDLESVRFFEKDNISRDMKDREDSVGKRTFALISHGKTPCNASYAYLIKMSGGIPALRKIDLVHNVKILRQDESAHIVQLFDTTNYVLFRKDYEINTGLLGGVTESCILSIRKKEGRYFLSVCDPDLRFYYGESEDYDLYRNVQEKAVYGRVWNYNDSIPSKIWVILNRDVPEIQAIKGNATIVQRANGKTILEFVCKDGMTAEIAFD